MFPFSIKPSAVVCYHTLMQCSSSDPRSLPWPKPQSIFFHPDPSYYPYLTKTNYSNSPHSRVTIISVWCIPSVLSALAPTSLCLLYHKLSQLGCMTYFPSGFVCTLQRHEHKWIDWQNESQVAFTPGLLNWSIEVKCQYFSLPLISPNYSQSLLKNVGCTPSFSAICQYSLTNEFYWPMFHKSKTNKKVLPSLFPGCQTHDSHITCRSMETSNHIHAHFNWKITPKDDWWIDKSQIWIWLTASFVEYVCQWCSFSRVFQTAQRVKGK